MTQHWYKEAVIYCADVDLFADSDDDGIGDFRGLIGRLDYLYRLGVTCLWLNPIHPTPERDEGYDVTDYYTVDPRLGTLGDFAELLHEAGNRGIRVLIDLVVNHTSDQHPWFLDACSSRGASTATGMCGPTPSRRTATRASSFPASRPRRGPTAARPMRGTTTASTTSSRT